MADGFGNHFASWEVSQVVANPVASRLQSFDNLDSMRRVVVITAAQEHVVLHIFADTLVTIERVQLPLDKHPDTPLVCDQTSNHRHRDNTGDGRRKNSQQVCHERIVAEVICGKSVDVASSKSVWRGADDAVRVADIPLD